VEWNRRLREVSQDSNGVETSIEKLGSSGRGYIIPELELTVQERVEVRADFVVGADGHNSQLRRHLGIGSAKAGTPQLYAVYEMETVEPLDHEMKLVFTDPGVSVLWPMAENKCRLSFQIVPPEAAADFPQKDRNRLIIVQTPSDWDSFHHLRRFLAERAPWFQAEVKDILWIAHVQFERQLALHFGEGRCWLAGDAAHQASPAGMQSMNLGLKEAADLADTIKSILRDHADMGLLQDFDKSHRGEWKRLLGLKAPAEPPEKLSPWARQRFATILGNLPASGEDLDHLMEKL
jgi:2-polyprenyl-6-methoxyphenol hydroxylase-like FAD-dependent oxidoreductase